MSDITINEQQKLYVIPSGNGYSCLGFEVAYNRAVAIGEWLYSEGIETRKPNPAKIGTLEGYGEYRSMTSAAREYYDKTRKRCPVELNPQLNGLEGKRIEVTNEYGEKLRFWVGRSTGWMPCHLEIKKSNSSGGSAISPNATFTNMKVVKWSKW
jgi:hypothetical protein